MWVQPLHLIERIGLTALGLFSIHRIWLLGLWWQCRSRQPHPLAAFDTLPFVTVQLPVFNEPYVVRRLLEAVARFDYPKDRVEIQLLDDSTDHTPSVAAACIAALREQGYRVHHLRRAHRRGFKAGALAEGLSTAQGELVAVFDADFVPQPDFLRRTVHYFTDPRVGMVQARWGHLNRPDSPLTRAQALMLDGHFLIEQVARSRSGRFFNFNGSAGVWRRAAITDAGGWQSDTLSEDLDLSYRAQLKGWRFIYADDVTAPAELPIEMSSLKIQQHRWTKGSIQAGLKLLPAIWRSRQPLRIKIEASFHLGNWFHYPLGLLCAMLMLPTLILSRSPFHPYHRADWEGTIGLLLVATTALFYGVAYWRTSRPRWQFLIDLPLLMSTSMGLALNNTRGVLQALRRTDSPFHRTPKYNGRRRSTQDPAYRRQLRDTPWWWSEVALGLYTVLSISYAALHHLYAVVPFLLPLAAGFLYAGLTSLSPWLHAAAELLFVWRKPAKAYELG